MRCLVQKFREIRDEMQIFTVVDFLDFVFLFFSSDHCSTNCAKVLSDEITTVNEQCRFFFHMSEERRVDFAVTEAQ